jgi:tetratricopeptide (TPR) repeat protein
MARTGLRVNRCAGVVLIALGVSALSAAAGDDPNARKRNQLLLQASLEEGLDHLQRGHYREAVVALEKRIALIDGNRRYLMALRDAYRGYVRELQQAGKYKEAKTYQEFLAILEPSSRQRSGEQRPAADKGVAKNKVEDAPASDKLPASPPRLGGVVGRGKMADDPFDEANSAIPPRQRKSLLAQAESEFDAKHYDNACRLYARAERAEPGAASACQDRWAYCRLFRVAQALKRGENETGPGRGGELEREVREAVRMAPRLDGFGQRLLEQIKEAGVPAVHVEVKHTPRQGNGWALAETAHFRIFHAQSPEEAEKAARVVEATRLAMSRKWFGDGGETWSPRCDIYLHPTVKGYTRCPGNPPAASPGHSTIKLDSGRVVERRIDARCDEPKMLTAVLPHETTHIVLAGRFGRHHVPRWADEGSAVLSEPRERINLHLNNLPRHKADGVLFSLGKLMQMDQYPEPRLIGPFYAQSVSLVEFLCKKKDATTFTRFLKAGLDEGYESALRRFYGWGSFAEAEREWQQYAFGEAAVARVAEKRR